MAETFWQLYGATVRLHRTRKGWSQQELAKYIGMSAKSYISEIENGEKVPNGDVMVDFAKLFGVTVSSMLGESTTTPAHIDNEILQSLAALFMLVQGHEARTQLMGRMLADVSGYLTKSEPSRLLPCTQENGDA